MIYFFKQVVTGTCFHQVILMLLEKQIPKISRVAFNLLAAQS